MTILGAQQIEWPINRSDNIVWQVKSQSTKKIFKKQYFILLQLNLIFVSSIHFNLHMIVDS